MARDDDIRYAIRRNGQLLDAEKDNLQRIKNAALDARDRKRSTETEMTQFKAQQRSFEARLEQVKSIITFFSQSIARSIGNANKTASALGEKYASAIRCNMITSASMERAFHSPTIEQDTIMLSPAVAACESEKARLEQSIENLRKQIHQCEVTIDALVTNLKGMQATAEQAQRNIQTYTRRIDALQNELHRMH